MRLVDHNIVRGSIVLSLHPQPVETFAADELRKFIRLMSGAEIPVRSEPDASGVNVFIGSAVDRDKIGPADLGFDGYIVRSAGSNLYLAGARPHSCLYAVYHLLEHHLGCGFFDDGDQVPRTDTIEIPVLNDLCKPRFQWRICFNCTQDHYSGMRWWTWEEFKPWVERVAKKRFNMWQAERLVDCCGITALAANRLGVPVALTAWEEERMKLLRRVLDYARMMGIRFLLPPGLLWAEKEAQPGVCFYHDKVHVGEFIRGWARKTGEAIPMFRYDWGGLTYSIMDPRHPTVKKYVTAVVQSYGEELGTDHLYCLEMPSEGTWAGDNMEELNRVTAAMVTGLVDAVKEGDPAAEIWSKAPCAYNKTFAAQKEAVRTARCTVLADFWLNMAGRLHDFMMCDYYWGLPWTTGMGGGCGSETNPFGNIREAIRNAQRLADDPRADHCIGFRVSAEHNHRNPVMMDLYAELAWNPADVEPEAYLRRWTLRRYGPDGYGIMLPAVEAVGATLLAEHNLDIDNATLYRRWRGSYLSGLTPGSVKRTISYLPKLHEALEIMAGVESRFAHDMRYRFDLVDLGRTYLGAVFNDYLGNVRKALRAGDRNTFEKFAGRIPDLMSFIARWCGAHPQFRLKTHDDWAARWPQAVPGHDNAESNWITFTILLSPQHIALLDYMAEDYAELVEHYFKPRVVLYLQKMRELLEAGKDISGRLVNRGSDEDVLFRMNDNTPPQGKLPWSPYGITCEPELTREDDALALRIARGPSMSGRMDFHDGPMEPLCRELLKRYPVPEDTAAILEEPDIMAPAVETVYLKAAPGETIRGFRAPGIVEQVVVPEEVRMLVQTEELYREYSIQRGDVVGYRVLLPGFLELKRLADEPATAGDHAVMVFSFAVHGKSYIMRYDPGSTTTIAGLRIEKT